MQGENKNFNFTAEVYLYASKDPDENATTVRRYTINGEPSTVYLPHGMSDVSSPPHYTSRFLGLSCNESQDPAQVRDGMGAGLWIKIMRAGPKRALVTGHLTLRHYLHFGPALNGPITTYSQLYFALLQAMCGATSRTCSQPWVRKCAGMLPQWAHRTATTIRTGGWPCCGLRGHALLLRSDFPWFDLHLITPPPANLNGCVCSVQVWDYCPFSHATPACRHGNTFLFNGHRMDQVTLLGGATATVDFSSDNPGTWLVSQLGFSVVPPTCCPSPAALRLLPRPQPDSLKA